MNSKNVTYEDYESFSGTSLLTLEETLDLFRSMQWKKGAYLYFEISNVSLLQLYFHDAERFIAEVTNDSDEMIYLQKYATADECEEIISRIFLEGNIGDENLYFRVPITTKTLDDVMNEI